MNFAIKPQDILELSMLGCMPENPTVFSGANGLGKSEIALQGAREYAKSLGLTPVDTREKIPGPGEYGITWVNFSGMAPEDIRWPVFSDGAYTHRITDQLPFASERWAMNGYTRDTYRGVVICDEIGKEPDLLKMPAQWVNERQWGNGEMVPAHVGFIFTTNDSKHNSHAYELTSDLISRVQMFTVEKDVNSFMNYHVNGSGEKLHPLITLCCKHHGEDFLFTQDYEDPGKPFACPRSMVKASRVLDAPEFDDKSVVHRARLHAAIGTRATVELLATYRAWSRLGNIEAMISDPRKHEDEIKTFAKDNTHNGKQTIASVIAMLVKRVQKDSSQFGNVMEFFNIMGNEEDTVTFVAICVQSVPEVRTQAAFVRHYADNQIFYF